MDESKIKKMLTAIRDAQPISDRLQRRAAWEKCWHESEHDAPEYFSNAAEYANFVRLRAEAFATYLNGIDEVAEFGCGIGHNLSPLIGSGKKLRGFDWTASAVRRCKALGIEAEVFDMFHPHAAVTLHGAVLTIHALEQLGTSWRAFLEFLVARDPKICIHIEPIEELYNETDLQDFLMLSYHRKRGYLSGFLPALQALEKRGEIELLEVRRADFSGEYHNAYSTIVWRPR